jgi:hypothetical protein
MPPQSERVEVMSKTVITDENGSTCDAEGNEYLPFDDGFDVEFTHNGKRCSPEIGVYSGRTHAEVTKRVQADMDRAYGSPVVITSVRKCLATRINEENFCGKLRDYLFCARCGCQAKIRDIGTLPWGNMHKNCFGTRPNKGDGNL